ncbi:hypothetical protein MIDIC_70077 [Alphaproteobacteria bacterium]
MCCGVRLAPRPKHDQLQNISFSVRHMDRTIRDAVVKEFYAYKCMKLKIHPHPYDGI